MARHILVIGQVTTSTAAWSTSPPEATRAAEYVGWRDAVARSSPAP